MSMFVQSLLLGMILGVSIGHFVTAFMPYGKEEHLVGAFLALAIFFSTLINICK